MVVNQAGLIFPDYFTVPFKVPVETEDDRKIPDLAIIDKSYRRWWVVEVEMAHHSLNGHVIPQIETFTRGTYGNVHSEYLLKQLPRLDYNRISDMVKWNQPGVLVIVNQDAPSWVGPIHDLGGLLMIVQIFRSDRNGHVFRVNGDALSELSPEFISLCRLDPRIPRLLQIDSPALLGVDVGETVSIFYEGGITNWSRLDTADQVWLNPMGNNPLSSRQEYAIERETDGRLFFSNHN